MAVQIPEPPVATFRTTTRTAAWPVIGHEAVIHALARDLAAQRLRHAYLFTGPAAIGKHTLAIAFAQAIQCEAPDAPCGHCRTCQLIAQQRHPGVHVLLPEVSGKIIKTAKIRIETVRDLIRQFALKPMEGARRVALLVDFESANAESANALLKTLEEPPGAGILIVTAASPEALLPTIVSRCEHVALRPLPVAQVQAALQARWQAPAAQAELLAQLSGGRLGWAVGMLQDGAALERRTQHLDTLQTLRSATRRERFNYAESMREDRDAVVEALGLWLTWWRDALLLVHGSRAAITNLDRAAELQACAGKLDPNRAMRFVEQLLGTLQALNQNANLRLALEALLLQLP